MAMTLVSTVTVGSGGAANIEWTNIPQTGKDLLLVSSLRTNTSGNGYGWSVSCRFNSDSGFNYNYLILYGITGDSPATYSQSLTTRDHVGIGSANDPDSTSNTFSSISTLIANYTSSTAKSLSSDGIIENNATRAVQQIQAGNWTGTSAINSLRIYVSGQNFVQHSTASLYIIS